MPLPLIESLFQKSSKGQIKIIQMRNMDFSLIKKGNPYFLQNIFNGSINQNMSYTTGSITNLKDQVNIVDVIGRSIPLKKAGSSYKANCPFHSEKTPSFNVNEQRQMFYCFGCQASGDVIEFVKRYYNLDFNDAVERLANEYSIELEQTKGRNEDLEKYYQINKEAANYFYKSFTERANKGYSYMKGRGVEPKYLKKFGIGYADESWLSLYEHLKSKGFEEKDMLEVGLISVSNKADAKANSADGKRYFDKFRDRVMFPIINTRGKVIGFGGRALSKEDNPKYMNSQESKVFQKKNNLYGLNISRTAVSKSGYLILVEGYMDVVALFQAGIENVAASLGTALTEQQARMIKRYTKKAVLCYDSDQAGRSAALRGMEILRAEGLDVRVMYVTDGKDPDEYIKVNGKDAFLKLVDKAMFYGDYKIINSIHGLDLENHQDRITAIKRIAGVLRTLTPGEREEYASKMAKELDISKSVLLEEANTIPNPKSKERNQGTGRTDSVKNIDVNKSKNKGEESGTITPLENEVIRLILRDDEYISRVEEIPDLIETETAFRLFNYIKGNLSPDGGVDINKLLDQMEEYDRKIFYNILENVVISGDEELVFRNLVKRNRINKLQKEVERINDILRYAGESEADSEEMKGLMRRSMELQREIAKEKAEEN